MAGHFVRNGFVVGEYTNEEDLLRNRTLPPARTLLLLSHDWPTVNEDCQWMGRFWAMIDNSPVCVPTREQLYFIFRKSDYLNALLKAGTVNLQPTYCVDDNTDLHNLSEEVAKMGAKEGKFVIKENFSAGKEGVTFIDFSDAQQVYFP